MAGLFPSIGNSQNVDQNGVPLGQSTLTVYVGGTLGLATCYQDINLINVAPNPMQADATGRLPLFYVADGVYRVRLVDYNGHLIYDYPQVASIGASTSGGGGTSVDPTTIFQTGDTIWVEVSGARTGWVRDNGGTIGSATSGASERANADCQNLFLFLWNNFSDTLCPVLTGRGVSAAADWAANKQITLPDKTGCVAGGLDNMGQGVKARWANVPVQTGGVTTAGSILGENTHRLTVAEAPAGQITFNAGNHSHAAAAVAGAVFGGNRNAVSAAQGGVGSNQFLNTTAAIDLNVVPTSAVPSGDSITDNAGGNAHNNVPRTVLGTFYRKL